MGAPYIRIQDIRTGTIHGLSLGTAGQVSARSAASVEPRVREWFERDGVLVFPDFLGYHQLETVNAELQTYYAAQGVDLAALRAGVSNRADNQCDVQAWAPVEAGNQTFTDLMVDPTLDVLTKAVLGDGYEGFKSLVMFSLGGGEGQAWHQDCPPDDSGAYNLNRLFYTEDVGADEGAIVFVPGSHRAGRISPGEAQESLPGEVALTPKAGTLVFLHGHVYHRVTPNRTHKPRVSVNFRAYPAGVSPDVNRIGIYRNHAFDFRTGEKVDR
jgi:ectoine hydroxylase